MKRKATMLAIVVGLVGTTAGGSRRPDQQQHDRVHGKLFQRHDGRVRGRVCHDRNGPRDGGQHERLRREGEHRHRRCERRSPLLVRESVDRQPAGNQAADELHRVLPGEHPPRAEHRHVLQRPRDLHAAALSPRLRPHRERAMEGATGSPVAHSVRTATSRTRELPHLAAALCEAEGDRPADALVFTRRS